MINFNVNLNGLDFRHNEVLFVLMLLFAIIMKGFNIIRVWFSYYNKRSKFSIKEYRKALDFYRSLKKSDNLRVFAKDAICRQIASYVKHNSPYHNMRLKVCTLYFVLIILIVLSLKIIIELKPFPNEVCVFFVVVATLLVYYLLVQIMIYSGSGYRGIISFIKYYLFKPCYIYNLWKNSICIKNEEIYSIERFILTHKSWCPIFIGNTDRRELIADLPEEINIVSTRKINIDIDKKDSLFVLCHFANNNRLFIDTYKFLISNGVQEKNILVIKPLDRNIDVFYDKMSYCCMLSREGIFPKTVKFKF